MKEKYPYQLFTKACIWNVATGWISSSRNSVVLEIKSVEGIPPIHEAQLVTYLSLGGWSVGLLINFNVLLLKDGIRRRVLNFKD